MRNLKQLYKQYIAIIILMVVIILIFIPKNVVADEKKKSILIINSYHKGYKWSDDIMTGIESIISTSTKDINVDIEYMDMLRNSEQEYIDKLYEIYKSKYENKKLDVVICCDDYAYDFVLLHQSDIFANVPIVFCGVNYYEESNKNDNKMITGVIEDYDIAANLDLILKVHPKTKNIYVVNDITNTGKAINKRLNEIIPKYKEKLNFINLQNRSMNEILDILKKPKENSVILFLIFFQDVQGNKFNYDESSKIISQKTKLPMYGSWEFSLGNGIIGGMLTSGHYQGKTAAEITLSILSGVTISSIPIKEQYTNSYMFDYSQMKRFGIKQSQLPIDGYIINNSQNDRKQILILNSYHGDMKWTNDIVSGIKSVLDSKDYDFYVDYMDAKRNYTEEYKAKIEDLLKYKYKDKSFDLIITSDDDAYDFMKRYHSKLFSSVPLLFCGLNYYSETDICDTNSTGVIENIDVKKTIELALIQNPKIKQVVIINDNTLTGKANKSALENILPYFKGKVNFIFYDTMSMSEIQEKVSKLSKDTIVYLLTFNKDKSNNIYSYEESTKLITSKSNVPVYGAWDFNLGYGIVGGLLANGESQGKLVAELAARIFQGEKISEISVIKKNANKYMFDYRQLKKYEIDLSTLPNSSIIINKPQYFQVSKSMLMFMVFCFIPLLLILFVLNYKKFYRIKKDKTTIEELEITAATDFLTETLNRSAGFRELNKLIVLSNLKKTNFFIGFIDLNNLKYVNDNYGHNEGDNYIKIVVDLIKRGLFENQILFRFGGDEFVILFPDASLSQVKEIMNNIDNLFKEYLVDKNCSVKYEIGISYGFSEYNPGIPVTVEDLINIADMEMYKCKQELKARKAEL